VWAASKALGSCPIIPRRGRIQPRRLPRFR
jgi:hypothetical protein